MQPGKASGAGTRAYAQQHAEAQGQGFFRDLSCGWRVSSIGMGTYLGHPDETTDEAYSSVAEAAVRRGINVLDTAINYRHQRSERSVGAAIQRLISEGVARREELVVCTKGGFLTPGAVPETASHSLEVVGKMHSMAPDYLADQIEHSRNNIGVETIDIYYLHNPETQLNYVACEVFEDRMRRAFALLEEKARAGVIQFYGTATWNGYRQVPDARDAMRLSRLLELAREAGGSDHRFRCIQLPVNMAMPEAFSRRNDELDGQCASVLEVASANSIDAVGSASLLQAQLTRDLPAEVAERFPGAASDAQRALQFARSTPGIGCALVGMSRMEHLEENLGVARFPPLERDAYEALFDTP
jgi:aryl-alcohol dehydrogenase-like predicted oxidoreductase